MDSRKKWKKTVDSDDKVPLFPESWAPKAKRVDSNDEVPLFLEGWGRSQSASILNMRCHYFPRVGRRRKNAIPTTTFHYFPRAVSGRQSERDARRDARRACRAGEAAPTQYAAEPE